MSELKEINRVYSLPEVAADEPLTREIQQRLIDLGLLEPPVDGIFGPKTTGAFHRFQELAGIKNEEEALGPKTAAALLQSQTESFNTPPLAIRATRNTIFKTRPLQSSYLNASEQFPVAGGQTLALTDYEADHRRHYRIVLENPVGGHYIWYAFEEHIEILENRAPVPPPVEKARSVRLNVPYKSQLDNWYNPSGACNVTSIAMCLDYLGVPRYDHRYSQLEDELYRWCLDRGYSRHDPRDLAQVVRDYRRRDDYTDWGSIERCQDHLREGNPCVAHGYFTSFGHIVVLVGFDDRGFIVHDPYGEWFPSGYRTDLSGAYLHYSYNLIRRTCIPDGQFWVHYISR
jgi:uncharacterized protein YvpB